MRKMTKLEWAVLATALLGSAAPAFADYGWYTCRTSSNGYNYSDGASDIQTARQQAINDCTSSPYTANGDCRYNASCDGDQPYLWARCTTTSNGYTFRDGAQDLDTAREQAISDCTSSPYTNNGACRADVQCQGGSYYPPNPPSPYPPGPPVPPGPTPYPPGPPVPPGPNPYPPGPPVPPGPGNHTYVCSTQSNGRHFSVPGRDYNTTLQRVIDLCVSNGFTDQYQCRANASCQ